MYDPVETDLSLEYLKELIEKSKRIRIAILGGWATFFYVNEEYRKAFGVDYLKSRDIDLYFDPIQALKFKKIIENFGFQKSAYYFRYEIIYDRVEKSIISLNKSKSKEIYNLVYVFLDLFSIKKSILDAWLLDLKNLKIEHINNIPIVSINTLLRLKAESFFGRDKLDKELKDACDIYALLFYSNKKIQLNSVINKTLEKIYSRNDLCNFIAENVLLDVLKSGIVKQKIRGLLNSKKVLV